VIWFLLLACGAEPVDADGDGWPASEDCDEHDASVHPRAQEVCGNDRDDDCDLTGAGCGLFGPLDPEDATVYEAAGLGSVVVGGATPAIAAPGRGVLLLEEQTWIDAPDDGFGAALASSEDALLIGDPDVGYAQLVGETTRTFTGGATLGAAVAFVGESIALGAPSGSGVVYLFDSPDADRSVDEADAVIASVVEDGAAGSALAAGDLDGDGIADLAIAGVPHEKKDPFAWVVYGPIQGSVQLGDADATFANAYDPADTVHLAGPCDLDGDGSSDLLLSLSTDEGHGFWELDRWYVTGATLHWFGSLGLSSEAPGAPACGDASGDGLGEVANPELDHGLVTVDSGQWRELAWLGIGSPATVAFTTDADGFADLLVAFPEVDTVLRFAGGPGI
jgi:hypothetical protein